MSFGTMLIFTEPPVTVQGRHERDSPEEVPRSGHVETTCQMGTYYAGAIEPAARAAVCWDPRVGADRATTTQGPLQQVATALFGACGIRMDATVACWGLGLVPDMETPPSDQLQEIDMGEYHGCGLRADGSAVCWGRETDGETIPPVRARFRQISAGVSSTCGVLVDGTIVCWGKIAKTCASG